VSPFVVPFIGGIMEERPDFARPLLRYMTWSVDPFADELFPELEWTFLQPDNQFARGCHQAVGRLFPQIVAYASNSNPQVAIAAIQLLAKLGAKADDVLHALNNLDPASEVAPTVALAKGVIGRLTGAGAHLIPSGPTETVEGLDLANDIARLLLGDDSRSEQLMQHLTHPPDDVPTWWEASMRRLLFGALVSDDHWPSITQLEQFLSSINEQPSSRIDNHCLADLARRIFPDGLPAKADLLNDRQRIYLNEAPSSHNGIPTGRSGKIYKVAIDRYMAGEFDPTI